MTDDADSGDDFLRAIAAAPAAKPPTRQVTAMVVRFGAAAPLADQIDNLRRLVTSDKARLERQPDDLVSVIWYDAVRAAACALELRDALPESRIALASGTTEAAGPAAIARIVERAVALIAVGRERICVDASTAELIEPSFELAEDGSQIVLVEPMASGTPALGGKVIGNYRIVRLLGTGGMGVVYLAEHVALGRKAVVKFVQDRLARDTTYTQRFFTEAKTAASIRHPGIVDVFDYGTDDTGRGYIVMELLEGESLRTRLRRDKPMAPELAVALGTQIANALGAAHAAGVIHRDLKPDNLFLVGDHESPHRVRAKVLDFGLAKVTDDDARVTQSGNFVGTPLYMSPEQCRAKAEVDHRTDIYSLGCILFEMVCGRPPFLDQTVGDLIIAHNTVAPPAPRELVPDLAPGLERVILRALAKHPGDRFQTMEQLAAALAAPLPQDDATPLARPRGFSDPPPVTESTAAPPARPRAARRWARTLAIAGAAAVALVVIALGVGSLLRTGERGAAAGKRRAIAVLDFANRGARPESAWLATALAEVVVGDLQPNKGLYVLPGGDVARMAAELGAGDWTPDRLARIRALGADYVVAGGYLAAANGQLRVDVAVYDTSTQAVIAKTTATGVESDLLSIGVQLAGAVERELGVSTDEVVPAPAAVLPAKASTARLYAEGLRELRHFELARARDLLGAAAADSPDDPLVHAALAAVWRELGYDGKARQQAKLAYDFAAALPRENQLAIEAQYRESTGQWEQAITAYRTLVEFFPSRLDYGLALAATQTRAGDAKSAYATLEALRKLPHPLGSDPRIELAEVAAAEEADDMERVRVHAERAVLFARKRGARLLLAKALLRLGWAQWTRGLDDAEQSYAEARQLFSELGDRAGLARVLNNIALDHHRKHRDREAEETFAEALALAETIGDTQAQAWVLNNWGYVLADAGELAKALTLTRKKLELGGERGDTPSSQAAAHVNISEILRWQGELADARTHCAAAEDLLRGLDARRFAAFAALHCGELARAADDIPGAKKRFQQAIGWSSDVMTPAESAEMRVAMARAELDDGRAAEAAELARGAVLDLRTAKEGSQQICALAVLASALLGQDRAAEAAEAIAPVATLPAEGVSFACRLEAEIAEARIAAAVDPRTREAQVAKLSAIRERAARATFVQLELAARLASGRVQGPAGRGTLRELARDAAAKGFMLIARQATEAAR